MLISLIDYFKGGHFYNPKSEWGYYSCTKFSDICSIIEFFNKYPIDGVKLNDYQDWCKIYKLMSEGLHLTLEGINIIQKIKLGMNKGRKY